MGGSVVEVVKRLRAEKKLDEAIKAADEGLRREPENEELLEMLADMLAVKGDFQKAVEKANVLLEMNPKNKLYWLKRSVFRFKLDDREGALEDIMRAREIDPYDINVVKGIVDVNTALGNYDAALEAIENIRNQNFTDESILERKRNLLRLIKLREEGDPYNFLLDTVRSNVKDDNLLVARSLLEKVKERRDAEYYETACVLYRKMGMSHNVIELAQEAAQKGMTNDKIKRTLAFAYMDIHKFEEAVRIFDELIENAKEDATLLADRAIAKMNCGDWKGALNDINEAIKINPHRDIYFIRKGDIVARVEGIAAAIEYYKEAIRLNPLNQEAHERMESAGAMVHRDVKESDNKLFR